MAIPDYQTLMLPALKLLADRQEHMFRQSVDTLADQFNLTSDERKELLPSGMQAVFTNRVGWTLSYMKHAGLLESNRRGYYRITDQGLEVLNKNPARIDDKFLRQFKGFRDFVTPSREKPDKPGEPEVVGVAKTPEDLLTDAYQTLRNDLVKDLLQQVKASPPSLFENLVVELLVKMGYGGSLRDAGKAVGKTGDEGIDGVIKEDRLGLDIIYIQAKRWDGTVGRPEIQKFAGALQGQRARKGIFITTSDFSQDAQDYASRIDSKIILINGNQVAQFMIDYNIGVTTQATYEIKKIDDDYFTEQ